MESQPSSPTKRIFYILLAIAIVLIVIAAGILVGRQLGGGKASSEEVVAPTPSVEIVQPTATAKAEAPQGSSAPSRVAVPGGRVETTTGIGILPPVQLAGNRRYLLRLGSSDGAVDFSGSYTRGSIDPKIAIDVMQDIKGKTPWEQEIQPPAADARTWTLGVTASTVPVGKNLQIAIWDVGPR